jgi:hypothetical protein
MFFLAARILKLQACKRKAEDETSERPSKLIIKEIEKVGVAELVTHDIKSVRQAMYRQRRKPLS